jgi:hypothetical protein
MTRTDYISVVASVGMAFMTGLVSGAGHAEAATQTLIIKQQPPVLEPVDLLVAGHSHGDMLAFEAAITADDGAVGTLRGILITVDLPNEGDGFEDRIGQIVFDLGAGNSIVVAGASVYAEATAEMTANKPQVRVVIGGTGNFLGARGQVTTARNSDGTYEHRFELLD